MEENDLSFFETLLEDLHPQNSTLAVSVHQHFEIGRKLEVVMEFCIRELSVLGVVVEKVLCRQEIVLVVLGMRRELCGRFLASHQLESCNESFREIYHLRVVRKLPLVFDHIL